MLFAIDSGHVDVNGTIGTLVFRIGNVAQRVVITSCGDGLVDRIGKALRVVNRATACARGDRLHHRVFGCLRLHCLAQIDARAVSVATAWSPRLPMLPQASSVHGIHRDLCLGKQLHRFSKLRRIGIRNLKRVRQRRVWNHVEWERSGEPDQVFAAREPSKVVCQRIERIERVLHAEAGFQVAELLLKRSQIRCHTDGRRPSLDRRRCFR